MLATDTIEGIIFTVPRLSRFAIREMWMDRFVNSMLMDENGHLPDDTHWCLVSPDKDFDEIEYLPNHFDLLLVSTSDMESLKRGYAEYREHMAKEYGNYAEEEEIESFLPEEPVVYRADEDDLSASIADRVATEEMAPLYDYFLENSEEEE